MTITNVFIHPTIEGAYIVETDQGNVLLTSDYAAMTSTPTEGLEAVYVDLIVQGVVDNALNNASTILNVSQLETLQTSIQNFIDSQL